MSMRLDDEQIIDGGSAESGVGEELAPFIDAPTDYVVTLRITQNEDATALRTIGQVEGQEPVQKATPLLGHASRIHVRCGIDGTSSPPNDAGDRTKYSVRIDDISVELCRRP